jgi:hypothetical protein
MVTYALAIAWNWEFDDDFIAGIENECRLRKVSTYRVGPHNLHETLHNVRTGELAFRVLYDRASDADPAFQPLVKLVQQHSVRIINPHHHVERAIDKATMHLELMSHGLHVPYTIIISPYNKKKEIELSLSELEHLGRPFIIKPANTTGGGIGVVMGAESLKDIIETRQHHKNDKYLLQEKIEPKNLDGKRAWFRVYYAFGMIILSWWNDMTRIYGELSPEEEQRYHLNGLRASMQTIYDICQLDFFSSEIALSEDGKLIVVDYVNEICDMRLQSKYGDGVPDAIIHQIQRLIAQEVEQYA